MKNNKGFSLVELIIVIAIMAILVGVMAPQLIKYIEKTHVSSDIQLCDSVRTALTTATMDPDIVKIPGQELNDTSAAVSSISTSVAAIAEDILGVSLSDIDAQLKSKSASTAGNSLWYKKQGNQIKVYVSTLEDDIYSGN